MSSLFLFISLSSSGVYCIGVVVVVVAKLLDIGHAHCSMVMVVVVGAIQDAYIDMWDGVQQDVGYVLFKAEATRVAHHHLSKLTCPYPLAWRRFLDVTPLVKSNN